MEVAPHPTHTFLLHSWGQRKGRAGGSDSLSLMLLNIRGLFTFHVSGFLKHWSFHSEDLIRADSLCKVWLEALGCIDLVLEMIIRLLRRQCSLFRHSTFYFFWVLEVWDEGRRAADAVNICGWIEVEPAALNMQIYSCGALVQRSWQNYINSLQQVNWFPPKINVIRVGD